MICPENLAAAVATLAIGISKDKSTVEINVLAAIFNQLGDTLETIAAQRECMGNGSENYIPH